MNEHSVIKKINTTTFYIIFDGVVILHATQIIVVILVFSNIMLIFYKEIS